MIFFKGKEPARRICFGFNSSNLFGNDSYLPLMSLKRSAPKKSQCSGSRLVYLETMFVGKLSKYLITPLAERLRVMQQ